MKDGNPGSPLIALEIINQCKAVTKMYRPQIKAAFIEMNYADDLRKALVYSLSIIFIMWLLSIFVIN